MFINRPLASKDSWINGFSAIMDWTHSPFDEVGDHHHRFVVYFEK
jgi:hypothetical protein